MGSAGSAASSVIGGQPSELGTVRSVQEGLQDPERGVVADLDAPGDALLIAFGGIKGGLAMAPFEFFRVAAAIPAKRVFLRDHEQAWYQRGVRGLGASPAEVAAGLRDLIEQAGVSRVVMTGNSAGGYAALRFGMLCGADEVHAFSPQTFLGRAGRALARDLRWRRELTGVLRRPPDLTRALREWPGPGHVHFDATHRLDRLHAERLRALPGIHLHAYEGGEHAVVRSLRDDGRLGAILVSALQGRTPS